MALAGNPERDFAPCEPILIQRPFLSTAGKVGPTSSSQRPAEGLEQPDGQGVCAEDEESEKGNEGVLSEDLVEMMIRAQMIAEGRSAVDVRLCLYIVGICAVR